VRARAFARFAERRRHAQVNPDMHALTVIPGASASAQLEDIHYSCGDPAGIRLDTLCVGICGTDQEILAGHYGKAPPGRDRLVLGHECVARVRDGGGGYEPGELVVPIVRRPDPVPCAACAVGDWDMCRNGLFTEHGIKSLDGFCTEELRVNPNYLVRVPPLLGMHAVLVEPASVVAKAWEHIERIGRRAHWTPQHVLVTGAGPIGLLAALLGRQRGLAVTVYDRATDGRKPALARQLGATYLSKDLGHFLVESPPDIVLECTGASAVVIEVMRHNARGCVCCLVGVSAAGRLIPVDVGALNRSIVLENDVIFGSVNANRRHYEQGVEALAYADPEWLAGLLTRRVPMDRWPEAFEHEPDDVKVTLAVAA
jgi:threonine dehydrogenase-like Zn-dependent dehydrogenase